MMQNSSASDSKESHVRGSDELPNSSSHASAEDWMSLLPGVHHSQPSSCPAGSELYELKYWSSDLVDRLTTSMASVYTGSSASASPSAIVPEAAEQQSTYETPACSSGSTFVSDLTSLHGDLLQEGSLWSQILLESAGNENLRARPIQDLNDAQYWRLVRQGGEFTPSDHVQKLEDLPPWDLALRNFTTPADEIQMSSIGKSDCGPSLQNQLQDDRLSGATYPQISHIETWPSTQSHRNLSGLHLPNVNQLKSEAESPRERFNPWCNIKQEYPYGSEQASLPPSWEHRSNIDICKFGDAIPQVLDGSFIKSHAAGVCNPSLADDQLPVPRRALQYSSRFPSPFLSQSSETGSTFPSGSLLSMQQLQGLDAATGEGGCAHALDHRLYDLSADATRRCVAVDPQLQYSYLSSTAQPMKSLRHLGLHVVEDGRESTAIGSDPKRTIAGSLTSSHESSSDVLFKRPRVEQANPTLPFKQVRKEKIGDRIATLQQLVSPFGKTDTASVLLEAIGYIKFLQEQVQVLSTPYLKGTSTTSTTTIQQDAENSSWSTSGSAQHVDSSEQPRKDLRSRGLCLVPVSCTLQVASDNGADYWSPSVGSGGYG